MNTIQTWLITQWYQAGARLYWLLVPISLLFRLLVGLRRCLYQKGLLRINALPVPVIVVGNITVGGTGKTPLVIALAEQMRAAGYQPGIISRGYAGATQGVCAVTANSDPAQVGDEPVLLASRLQLPVYIGKDRLSAAKSLLAEHASVNLLISDDGLQHYPLPRDIEIVVVDALRGFGNGHVLPAGPLREPLTRLRTVDAIVYNGHVPSDANMLGGNDHDSPPCFEMHLLGEALVRVHEMTEKAPVHRFSGHMIHAVAGIGHPERFFSQLTALGMHPIAHPFPDHYGYSQQDLDALQAECIVMTEKDAIKCRLLQHPQAWYLPVTANMEEAFYRRILDLLVLAKKTSQSVCR